MNLKKTLLSFAGAAAIVGSMLAPVSAADTTTQEGDTSVSVNEIGEFTFSLWGPAISFEAAEVDTNTSDLVRITPVSGVYYHRILAVNDYHASSDGYQLSMTATDLQSGGYFIDNENLSVKQVGMSPHSSCMGVTFTPVGGNPLQTVTFDLGGTFESLGSNVPLITGTAGRGCGGPFHSSYEWQLYVPAGTYTGGGSAVYEGDVTITDLVALPPV